MMAKIIRARVGRFAGRRLRWARNHPDRLGIAVSDDLHGEHMDRKIALHHGLGGSNRRDGKIDGLTGRSNWWEFTHELVSGGVGF